MDQSIIMTKIRKMILIINKEFRLNNNKMLSPSIESPNQIPLLCSSYIMSNQNNQGGMSFNEGFLGAPKFNQSPFRASLFSKNPSLIIPKVINLRRSSLTEPLIKAPRSDAGSLKNVAVLDKITEEEPAKSSEPQKAIDSIHDKAENEVKITSAFKSESVKSEKTQNKNLFSSSPKKKVDKVPLPSLFEEGVIYVSSLRYNRILKRRQSRSNQTKVIVKPK